MNLSISIVTNGKQQTTNLLETVKMSEIESPLDDLLTRFSLSPNSLDKPCDDNLFLALMSKIPCFEDAAPSFGLTQAEITVLRCDYNYEKPRRINMLWRWKRKNGSDATYLALVMVFLQMEDKYLAESVLKHVKTQIASGQITQHQNRERISVSKRRRNYEVRQKYALLLPRF